MRCLDYELGTTVSKTIEDTKLWKSDIGIVEIHKNTLAVPIKLEDENKGYVFQGHGKFILDTIVETEEGAIGKSIERELKEPFLLLGDPKEILNLNNAGEGDLVEFGYRKQQDFLAKAEDLFDRFFKKRRIHGRHNFEHCDGLIFAFKNRTNNKLDIFVAKGSELVYASKDKVFVSHRDARTVVYSSNGKSVIISKNRSVVIKKKRHYT